MPSYNTYTAILTKLPGLPQTTTATGYTDTVAIISHHLNSAWGIVNGKCARRYSVPFTAGQIPPMIMEIEEDICAYRVMRSLFSRDGQNKNDWTKEHYDEAIKLLDQIQKSEMDLVNTAGSILGEVSESDKLGSTMQDYAPIFNVDSELDWGVDSDLLDEIAEDKE